MDFKSEEDIRATYREMVRSERASANGLYLFGACFGVGLFSYLGVDVGDGPLSIALMAGGLSAMFCSFLISADMASSCDKAADATVKLWRKARDK